MTDAALPKLDLKRIIGAAQLPAMPQSAVQLLDISKDPNNGPAEFAAPIEADPGLAGQVLRFVNSSYFGFSREISSVKLAITLVGVRTIKNFALWSAVFSLMPNPRCGSFVLRNLWQDSLRRALFARSMATMLGGKETEEPFAAALLQDMAIPILAKEAPKLYEKLFTARAGGEKRLSELEQRVFGWTHADAAGILARLWKLPGDFAVLLESHQDIDRWAVEAEREPGKFAVALSALLPSTVDPGWTEYEMFESYYRTTAPPGSPAIAELFADLDRAYAQFAPVLRMESPGKSLVDALHESVLVES